ncbi:hypothetical protein D3C76_1331600 [compost metagenome]
MASRDQITGEQHWPTGHGDFRQQLPGGVAVAEMKLPTAAEQFAVATIEQHQATTVFEPVEHWRDEQRPVTWMRTTGALPVTLTHQVTGIGE